MKNKIFLFLIGLFGFSSLLSYLSTRLVHAPCLVEVVAIPLLYYYRKSIRIPQSELIWVILLVLLGTLIGLLNPVYSLKDILPIARCFLLGAIAFVISKNNNIFRDIDNLYIFCFGVFIGDLINAYILMSTILGTKFDKQYAVDINIIFSVLWAVLTILYKKDKYLILVFILVPTLSFISVSRGVSTFFVIGIMLAFILKIFYRPSKIVLISAFLFISYIILSSLYINNEETIRKFSPSMHFRMYTKVESFGENSIDNNRIMPYLWAGNHIDYYVLPRGFLGKKFLTISGDDSIPLMSPWDSAYMELLYTLGFFPLIIILFIYLYKLYSCYLLYIRTKELIFAASSAMLTLLFFEFFFTYGLIRSPFMVVCNGGFLGFIWRITKQPTALIGNLIHKND